MLCRGCNLDEHFIAQCKERDKPKLIAFANELIGTDAFNYSGNQILDMSQELPDDTWDVFLSSQVETQNEADQPAAEVELKEAVFASLADNAVMHEFIQWKARNDIADFETIDDPLPGKLSKPCVSPRTPVSVMTTSKVPRIRSSSQFLSSDDTFEGVMLDNGASGTPSGLPAYLRYCQHVGIKPQLRPSANSFVGIGKGIVLSLGVATIRMPLGSSFFLDFETDIIAQDVPLIFGLDQHRKHGCSSYEYQNSFSHHPSNTNIPVRFKKGHLYIEWPVYQAFFTKAELKIVHDRFGHPTSKNLMNLLKRARPEESNAETRKALEDLEARYKQCQTFAPKPFVYKVSMPTDELVFNHGIEVDLFWIEGDAVLHIIDRGTRYSIARSVTSQSAENIWNMIIDSWVTIFTGFPSIISHDRGPQFSSEFFKDACAEFVIIAKEVPTELFIRPPKSEKILQILGAPPRSLLKAIQPLYGLPESPSYWWSTFRDHHRKTLDMTPAVLDPCLFFRNDEHGNFEGAQAVLVDDKIGTGSKSFADDEKLTETYFQTKPRNETFPMRFNGVDIELVNVDNDDIPVMKQISYSKSIRHLNRTFSPAEFATARGKVAYVAVSTRPDIAYFSAKIAQTKAENVAPEDRKPLYKATMKLQDDAGLVFPKLDLYSLKIVGYSDASFAGNKDVSFQLGMFILLVNKYEKACMIHYASWKCRRVTHSILAAEIYAFSACLDYCISLRHDVHSILSCRLNIELYTDSKSLFDTIAKLTSLSEKRLLIDVSAIRESYHAGDLDDVAHLSSEYNLADCLTKDKESSLLTTLLSTGRLSHSVNQWIVREHKDKSITQLGD